jgi:hypothetical protein
LVQLDENRIRDAVADAFGKDFRIRHEVVIIHERSFLPSAFVNAFQPSRSSSPIRHGPEHTFAAITLHVPVPQFHRFADENEVPWF